MPSAVVYTNVPDNRQSYFRQQQRWKKGYLRATLFAGTFMWKKKHPIISALFYSQLLSVFTLPMILAAMLLLVLLGYFDILSALTFVASILTIGLLKGIDHHLRFRGRRHFLYGPVMEFMSSFVLPWLIVPALVNYKKNKWLTR